MNLKTFCTIFISLGKYLLLFIFFQNKILIWDLKKSLKYFTILTKVSRFQLKLVKPLRDEFGGRNLENTKHIHFEFNLPVWTTWIWILKLFNCSPKLLFISQSRILFSYFLSSDQWLRSIWRDYWWIVETGQM